MLVTAAHRATPTAKAAPAKTPPVDALTVSMAARTATALPGDPRISLPPAPSRRCDGEERDGLPPPSGNHSASWRTVIWARSGSSWG
jgi:hypothetical protein